MQAISNRNTFISTYMALKLDKFIMVYHIKSKPRPNYLQDCPLEVPNLPFTPTLMPMIPTSKYKESSKKLPWPLDEPRMRACCSNGFLVATGCEMPKEVSRFEGCAWGLWVLEFLFPVFLFVCGLKKKGKASLDLSSLSPLFTCFLLLFIRFSSPLFWVRLVSLCDPYLSGVVSLH